MKSLIICHLILATVFASSSKEIKSRNIVLAASRPEGRIANGWNARPGQFAYQVYLNLTLCNGSVASCGGTLISPTEILTAAHCLADTVKVAVLLGATDVKHAETIHKATAEDFVIHELFKSYSLENDIGIIRMPYTRYSKNIKPIKLPTKASVYNSFVDEAVITAGWGDTSDSGNKTSLLQFTNLNVISNRACDRDYIRTSHICASIDGQSSPCKGDSGGPLVLKSSNTLIGITSHGSKKGCEKGYPTLFTRIGSFLDWIEDNSDARLS